jgi:NitT/TauT family transport system ATP-binding protein
MANDLIEVKDLTKEYTDWNGYKIKLLQRINFNVDRGNFISIAAPEGSGKSSLLKLIGGLQEPTSGKIKINSEKPVVYIPSKPNSFPWFNVSDNLKAAEPEIGEKYLKALIRLVGLEGYEDHHPHNSSLGFRFRISLARALVLKPSVLLIDEPFDNIRSLVKEDLYKLLRKINKELLVTFVFTTTNISEAIFLSNKIYLMKKDPGEIIGSYSVNFPEERSVELFSKDQFKELRKKIEETFKENLNNRIINFSI